MRIVSIVIISNIASKKYPNNKLVNRTLLYFVVSTMAMVMFIFSPLVYVLGNIVITMTIYYVTSLFYSWKYTHKMFLFYSFLFILLFVTSTIPSIIIMWYKTFFLDNISEHPMSAHPASSNIVTTASKMPTSHTPVAVKLHTIGGANTMPHSTLFDSSIFGCTLQDLLAVCTTFTDYLGNHITPLWCFVETCAGFFNEITIIIYNLFDGTNMTTASGFPHGIPTNDLDSLDAYAEHAKSHTDNPGPTSSQQDSSGEGSTARDSGPSSEGPGTSSTSPSDTTSTTHPKVEQSLEDHLDKFGKEHPNSAKWAERGEKLGEKVAPFIPAPKHMTIAACEYTGFAIGANLDAMNNVNSGNKADPVRGESPSDFTSYEYNPDRWTEDKLQYESLSRID